MKEAAGQPTEVEGGFETAQTDDGWDVTKDGDTFGALRRVSAPPGRADGSGSTRFYLPIYRGLVLDDEPSRHTEALIQLVGAWRGEQEGNFEVVDGKFVIRRQTD